MFVRTVDRAFVHFQRTGQAKALALVFDRTAPELLRLARHLAARGVAAEDLLQQTFVTAIESRHRYDPEQPVLPWLVGILNNHARAERRRLRRPLDAGRLPVDATIDAGAQAEQIELDAALERAIDRLPEPCRPVLRLHLQHGIEPTQIARSLERPAGTVRAQLHRGLAMLRRLLPAGIGAGAGAAATGTGLDVVRQLVLQRCGGLAGGAWGAVTAWGVAIMVFDKKVWAATAAFVLCLCGGVMVALAGSDGTSPRGVVAASAATGAVEMAAAPALPTPQLARTGAEAAPTPDAPEPDRAALDTEPGLATLTVRIVDGQNAPIANLGVACSPTSELALHRVPPVERTDQTGRVEFRVAPRTSYSIETECTGILGGAQVADRGTKTYVTFQVHGGTVTGRVLRDDGVPMPAARIHAHGLRVEGRHVATTDAEGRFTLSHASRNLELHARAPGFQASPIQSLQVEPGAQEQIELRLGGPAAVIVGRVLQPNGSPAAGALVSCLPFEPGQPITTPTRERAVQVATAADGSYRIEEAPIGDVLVTANLAGDTTAPGGVRVQTGTHEAFAEVWLRQPAELTGRLTEGGKPLAEVVVAVLVEPVDQPVSYLWNLLGSRMVATDADGRFRLGGLAPGHLTARALRDGSTQIGFEVWELAAGESKSWEIDVAGHELRVRIEPPAPPGDAGRWFVMARREGAMQSSLQPADANGVVRFQQQQPGRYQLQITDRNQHDSWQWLASMDADVPGADVVLRVPPERLLRHELRGRVVDAEGAAVASQRLLLRSFLDRGVVSIANATTGPDGAFHVEGLLPGDWEIMATLPSGAVTVLGNAVLQGGQPVDLGAVVLR